MKVYVEQDGVRIRRVAMTACVTPAIFMTMKPRAVLVSVSPVYTHTLHPQQELIQLWSGVRKGM